MDRVVCAKCWQTTADFVVFEDVDGSKMTVCRRHTWSLEELLAELEG